MKKKEKIRSVQFAEENSISILIDIRKVPHSIGRMHGNVHNIYVVLFSLDFCGAMERGDTVAQTALELPERRLLCQGFRSARSVRSHDVVLGDGQGVNGVHRLQRLVPVTVEQARGRAIGSEHDLVDGERGQLRVAAVRPADGVRQRVASLGVLEGCRRLVVEASPLLDGAVPLPSSLAIGLLDGHFLLNSRKMLRRDHRWKDGQIRSLRSSVCIVKCLSFRMMHCHRGQD